MISVTIRITSIKGPFIEYPMLCFESEWVRAFIRFFYKASYIFSCHKGQGRGDKIGSVDDISVCFINDAFKSSN